MMIHFLLGNLAQATGMATLIVVDDPGMQKHYFLHSLFPKPTRRLFRKSHSGSS